jgi:hypothetical protein
MTMPQLTAFPPFVQAWLQSRGITCPDRGTFLVEAQAWHNNAVHATEMGNHALAMLSRLRAADMRQAADMMMQEV